MEITTDVIEYLQWGPVTLNATILFTWIVMAILAGGSWIVTRKISTGMHMSRGQNLLEVLLSAIKDQIREISQQEKVDKYLPFVGTLFIFIAVSNVLSIIPGFKSPTGSLSTTAALALCVFVAVPLYGIWEQGIKGYLKRYLQPSILMLPFNIIGEFSRTLTLAMRLYGNIMSGSMIVAILVSLVPLFVPLIMQVFGLLIGLIQAYVFSILAMVYIAAATEVSEGQVNQANEAA
ncbi:MAG: F0F1 ATP synthase subunit A [Anaerolineales bacterium]|nr:F0F1 ATP synthase subunit A [Anaerolineales bacterium]